MKSKTAAIILTAFTVPVLLGLMTCLSGQVILKEADINMDTVNKYFTATETNTLNVTTNKNITIFDFIPSYTNNITTNAYLFNWLPRNEDSIALVLGTNGVPVVEITSTGEVLYDTNNVSVATHIFWRELSFYIKRSLDQ